MKKYFLLLIFLSSFLSAKIYAQSIGLHFTIQQTIDSLTRYGLIFDSTIEGKIVPRLTKFYVHNIKKFNVEGSEWITFGRANDVTDVSWMANGMSKDDGDYVLAELKKMLGGKDPTIDGMNDSSIKYSYQIFSLWQYSNLEVSISLKNDGSMIISFSDSTVKK